VAPKAGETVTHIGAGTGYYTAILSMLTLPNGAVNAFEIDAHLAEKARRNLTPFDAVTVANSDATQTRLSKSDIIYVNAGVSAPPAHWLQALKPGGRLIFPWRPTEEVALALIVRAESSHFSVTPLMPAWFIPCVGASKEIALTRAPQSHADAWSIRSLWTTTERAPDETAVAIYPDVWFSSASPDAK
jgi:protein-L-isoaspartate(D-aspartate) O-methyltransferase